MSGNFPDGGRNVDEKPVRASSFFPSPLGLDTFVQPKAQNWIEPSTDGLKSPTRTGKTVYGNHPQVGSIYQDAYRASGGRSGRLSGGTGVGFVNARAEFGH
jgi:hypothetical protein